MLYWTDINTVSGCQRRNVLFTTGQIESAKRERDHSTDTPSETPLCEGKHEGKDAMPVWGTWVYISQVICAQEVRVG